MNAHVGAYLAWLWTNIPQDFEVDPQLTTWLEFRRAAEWNIQQKEKA